MTTFGMWPELEQPRELAWRPADLEGYQFQEIVVDDKLIATLEPRPAYCDRGHWWVKCYLPGLDGADMFPRYYMRKDIAERETIEFLRWRLWRIR